MISSTKPVVTWFPVKEIYKTINYNLLEESTMSVNYTAHYTSITELMCCRYALPRNQSKNNLQ